MRTIKTIILISIFPLLTVMAVSALDENDANVIPKSVSTLEKVQSKLVTIKGTSDISRIINLAIKQLSTAVSNSSTSCVSKLKTSLLKLDQASSIIAGRSCTNSKRKTCIQDNLADELLGNLQSTVDDLEEITVLDTDNNKIPDICDEDPDGDGIVGRNDNCPLINNPDQIDVDKNGTGDVCELFYCCQDSSLTVPLEECERKTIDSCNKEGGIVLGGIPPIQKRDAKKRAQSLAPIPDVGEGVCVSGCTINNYYICPNNCSRHGACIQSLMGCSCDFGYSGSDCSIYSPCPNTNNCSGHGFCSKSIGGCSCDVGWTGSDCSINLITSCSNDCSDNGFCSSDGCICDFGYSGSDCSVSTSSTPTSCPNNCSGNGGCNIDGTCICNFGYSGSDCSISPCPNDCSGNGECSLFAGTCTCDSGWAGSDCSITSEDFIGMLQDVVSMSTVPDMTYVSTTYDCDDFASDLEKELDEQGFNASFTLIWRNDGMTITGHAVTDVHPTNGEIIFIEPQNGMIIDLDEDGDGIIGFNNDMHNMTVMATEGMSHIEVYMDLNGAIMAGAPID